MKTRALLSASILVSAVGLLLMWRACESYRFEQSATISQTDLGLVHETAGLQDGVSSQDLARTPWTGSDSYKRRIIATVRDVAKDANQPVEFFGKVVDQDGNAVAGVKVSLSVRWTHELVPGTAKDEFNRFEVTTDANGLFNLTNTKGSLLTVAALEKDGYDPSPSATRQSYWYWASGLPERYTPDVRRPEIFRMWRKAGAETLVRKGISSALHYDGTPTMLDLMTGVAGSGGDLQVMLVRSPQQIAYGQRNYEWTLTLELPGGGLIVSNEEQMYLAPLDGYESRVVVHMAANDPRWTDEKSFGVYLKLRGNLYGRAEVKALVGSDRATTPFYITSFINPNGSRNLEYDSLQDVAQPPGKIP